MLLVFERVETGFAESAALTASSNPNVSVEMG
jgi:hypothetical protein